MATHSKCSCLENPRDRGAWWAAVSGVSQSRTQLKRLSSLAAGFAGGPGVKNPPANAEDTRDEGAHQSLTLVAFYSLCREPAVFTAAVPS